MTNLDITISISDVEEFKIGFLKAIAKNPDQQHLTDLQFLKKFIEDILFRAYKTGKMKIAQETTTPSITEDIIEVT